MSNRYVRIDEDNIVCEVFINNMGKAIHELFPSSLVWIECPDDEVIEWWRYASETNTFLPPVDPTPTSEEIQNALTDAIQRHMDAKARERNYDGILSLCTYATSTNPKFAAEGQAGVVWRDACWATAYSVMNEVLAGNREIPTVEELLAELPVFYWPGEVITDEVTP